MAAMFRLFRPLLTRPAGALSRLLSRSTPPLQLAPLTRGLLNAGLLPTQRHVLFGATFSLPLRRRVNTRELLGVYSALPKGKRRYSPLLGAALHHMGVINKLYDEALARQAPADGTASATDRLITSIFYKQGEQFRATQLKSSPAYTFSPTLLAKVMHHLNAGTLDAPEVRKALCDEWKAQYKGESRSSMSNTKINALLDIISSSKKECIKENYPLYFTETILLSFLHFKAGTRQEIVEFIKVLNEGEPELEERMKTLMESEAYFDDYCVEHGAELINGLMVRDNPSALLSPQDYEQVLLTLMLKGAQLGRVLQSSYSYQNQIVRPNCAEASFHNLCNILVYDEGKFNLSLLPKALQPNDALRKFYEIQQFKVGSINARKTGQAFMDLVSGHNELIIYRQKNYEVRSGLDNFLPIMRYLFGSTARSLEELSAQFSDTQRHIVFSKDKEDNITITIRRLKDKQAKTRTLTFLSKQGHTELRTGDYFQTDEEAVNSSETLSALAIVNLVSYPTLYVLLKQNIEHRIAIKPEHDSLVERFNLLRMYHPPTTPEAAFQFVRWSVDYANHLPQFHAYAHSLCRQFPSVLITDLLAEREDVALLALAAGVDHDVDDVRGYRAFHITNSPSMIAALIAAGADPNKMDDTGRTPLHYSLEASVVTALLAGGANPNAESQHGLTPLICASTDSFTSSVDIMKALLKGGADPNKTDENGETALFFVNTLEKVRALLEAGGYPRIVNKNGFWADKYKLYYIF